MTGLSTAVAAVLVALASAPLGAQKRAAPAVGDRVQIFSSAVAPGTLLRGELAAVRGDTLVILRDGTLRAVLVPLAQVEGMEVQRPRSLLSGLGRGLLFGASIGLVGGYVLGTIEEGGPHHCGDDCGLVPALSAMAGMATGTVLGAIVGVGAPGHHWVPADRPGTGSRGVALSIGTRL